MQSAARGGRPAVFSTMDAVRGVAALCVMFFHFTAHGETRMFPSGYVAVDIFFCLSGFVICRSYQPRLDAGLSLVEFAKIRLIRLYPLYLFGLALGFVNYLAGAILGPYRTSAESALFVVSSALLLMPVLRRFPFGIGVDRTDHVLFPLNGPAWSLLFELLGNALFVFLRPRGRRLALLLVALLAWFAATSLIYDQPCGWGANNVLGGFPRALYSFYLGTALCQLWERGALRVSPRFALLAPLFVPAVCCAPDGAGIFIALVLVAVPAIVSLSVAEPRSALARRAYALLGEISYPLYALHLPAFGLMKLALNSASGAALDTPPPLIASAALAILLIAASLALSRLYDRPARRKLAALLGPAPTLAAPVRLAARASP